MGEGAVDVVREHHVLTCHPGPAAHPRLATFRRLDPNTRPPPFKRYSGPPPVALPRDVGASGPSATAVLSGRGSETAEPLDARLLARILHHGAGVTRVSVSPAGTIHFRAAMSAGNLHPIEVYVVTGGVAGVPDGVHHFEPEGFGVTPLRQGDHRRALAEATASAEVGEAPASLVLTGIPWRTAWKYGERGWRHLYWDAGTMLANVLATAGAAGLGSRVLTGFVDAAVARLVGVDGRREMPLAVLALDPPLSPGPVAPEPGELGPPEASPLDPAPHGRDLPLLLEAQRAGDLADAGQVQRWRSAGRAVASTGPPGGDGPPPGIGEPIEAVILRRGSTRLMRTDPLPAEALRWGMATAARPFPLDAALPDGALVGHAMSVHAVEGLEPGAYWWRDGGAELVRPGTTRADTEHLCLDQGLGGDAAFTAFHMSDLDAVLGTLGARGYRAAQLAAGVASGRLALAAFALGQGATGLTFYDREVSAFFETDQACLLVTAVGVPAYRSKPGGPPGKPAVLTGHDRLMARLSQRLATKG